MKKDLLLLLLVGSISTFNAEAKKVKKVESQTQQKVVLSSAVDSASYAIGVDIATDINKNIKNLPGGQNIKSDLVLEAIKNIFMNDSANTLIKYEDCRRVYQPYLIDAEKKEAEITIQKNKLFLENNKKNPSVVETNSGLQYEVLKEAPKDAARPKASDKVKVHYKGTLLDGTVFDSSYDRNQPLEIELNRVIKGWTEGMQLMPVGSKYKFYIPSELGYGERGQGMIKPNSLLIFEVELLEILPNTASQTQGSSVIGKYKFEKYDKNK